MNNSEHLFSPITHTDLNEISKLQPDGWNDIIPDIKLYIESDFCSPVKLTLDNTILGIGASISFGNTYWLAHIIVDPDYRNSGLGFKIVNTLIADIEKNNLKSILLIATDLGEQVYKKAGFRVVGEYIQYEREKPGKKMASSDNIITFAERFRERIYELDNMITGEERRNLPLKRIDSSWLYVKGKELFGYYAPDIGEGPIIAKTEEAGIELMKLKHATIDKAVLPDENKAGREFLKENGFKETIRMKRMILLQDIDWNPMKIYSRIGGNFG